MPKVLEKPIIKEEEVNREGDLPELLSPAGSFEALIAAVENGADAVYLGLKKFNARRQAENFSFEELREAVDYAHSKGVKIYLAFNILIKNSELKEALESVVKAFNLGVDAVMLQDFGLSYLLRKHYPQIPLHASTQMNVHNLSQLSFLEKIGFKKAILSRELSLPEISFLCRKTSLEIEVFVHGALCFSYSGQCFFSSLVGRRSGNRGLCAQPCRFSYELWSDKEREKTIGPYLLSTSELMALSKLEDLWKAGVKALKIEGRLKSPEYVAATTRIYRETLDKIWRGEKENQLSLKRKIEVLAETFNRGFNCAYLEGRSGNELMSYSRPNHRGVFLGRVTFVNQYTGEVCLRLRRTLSIGDEVEFWVEEGGRVTHKVGKIKVNGKERSNAGEGEKAILFPVEERHRIKVGDRVFRKFNAPLMNEIRKSYLEKVRSRQVTKNNLFAERKRKRKVYLKEIKLPEPSGKLPQDAYLTASVSNIEAAWGALKGGADWVYLSVVPFSKERFDRKELLIFLNKARKKGTQIALRIPNVVREKEKMNVDEEIISYIDAFCLDNFGAVLTLKGYGLPFILDYHLYTFNSFSAHLFKECCISRVTVSLELNLEEIKALSSSFIFPLECSVHGFPKIMLSEHCILRARREKGCEEYCFKNKEFKLKDKKGYFFPFKTDVYCRSHVFNSRSLCLYPHLNELYQVGVRYFRIFLENISPQDAQNIVQVYKRGLLKVVLGEKVDLKEVEKIHPTFSKFTMGHLFRGVL
jgi:collagenase-like PrtC family protease